MSGIVAGEPLPFDDNAFDIVYRQCGACAVVSRTQQGRFIRGNVPCRPSPFRWSAQSVGLPQLKPTLPAFGSLSAQPLFRGCFAVPATISGRTRKLELHFRLGPGLRDGPRDCQPKIIYTACAWIFWKSNLVIYKNQKNDLHNFQLRQVLQSTKPIGSRFASRR